MSEKIIRFGIIGAGSIGSLFGGALADIQPSESSIKMDFFGRKAHIDAINKSGLKFEKDQKVRIIQNISGYEGSKNYLEQRGSSSVGFNFLFLCTKTYDIESAMVEYKPIIEKTNYLVVLQNGIGNEDIIKEYCEKEKILRIVTSNGALLKEPGHVIHTGSGFTKVGLFFKKVMKNNQGKLKQIDADLAILKNLLDFAGFKTTIVEDIGSECWQKVFVNVGINPFGALTGLRNGELLEIEGLRELMGEAVKEAIRVAEKKEIDLPQTDMIAVMYDVARKTAKNKNSMLQDVLKGKRTEIDFINGRIVKYAQELGLKVSINRSLTVLVKGLEYKNS